MAGAAADQTSEKIETTVTVDAGGGIMIVVGGESPPGSDMTMTVPIPVSVFDVDESSESNVEISIKVDVDVVSVVSTTPLEVVMTGQTC